MNVQTTPRRPGPLEGGHAVGRPDTDFFPPSAVDTSSGIDTRRSWGMGVGGAKCSRPKTASFLS